MRDASSAKKRRPYSPIGNKQSAIRASDAPSVDFGEYLQTI